MTNASRRLGAPEWLILIGGSVFVFVLGLSAYWQSDIRWLHVFQAWMYVAAVILNLRGSRWGFFIGFSAAGLWDYMNIFATTFFFNGLQQITLWLDTGHFARPELLIAVPAWFSNLMVVIGCVWAYSRQPEKSLSDLGKLVAAFVLTTAFFAADMALFQPRYLAIFPRLLHPHLP